MGQQTGLARRPGQGASTEQVDVQVEDRLPGAGADIEDGAVPLLNVALARDMGGGKVAAADDFGVVRLGFLQPREMFLRNDEYVRRRFGINVFEGENVFIFVNFLRGNLTPEDPTEQAIRISHRWLTLGKR